MKTLTILAVAFAFVGKIIFELRRTDATETLNTTSFDPDDGEMFFLGYMVGEEPYSSDSDSEE